jgi:hypothetical protein
MLRGDDGSELVISRDHIGKASGPGPSIRSPWNSGPESIGLVLRRGSTAFAA